MAADNTFCGAPYPRHPSQLFEDPAIICINEINEIFLIHKYFFTRNLKISYEKTPTATLSLKLIIK